MKYSKREVRELLDNGTHILKIEHTEDFTELVKELYPKDNFLEMNPIRHAGGHYLITSITYVDEWYWTDFETDRTAILFSEIEKDEVVWNGNDMQFRLLGDDWADCGADFNIEYRMKPEKSHKELLLEALAEELGYNLTKK
jgi:hypothetical protein